MNQEPKNRERFDTRLAADPGRHLLDALCQDRKGRRRKGRRIEKVKRPRPGWPASRLLSHWAARFTAAGRLDRPAMIRSNSGVRCLG